MVACFNGTYDGGDVGCSQMGSQSGTSGNTFFKFVVREPAAVALVNQLPGRQCAGTFGGERPGAVQCIVGVYRSSVPVDGYGNPST